MGIIRKTITKSLRGLDRFQEPVSLNINGEQSVGSKLGGTCSLIIFILIAVFTYGRVDKLTNRLEPSIYEVNQGIDMSDPDTPVFNL